LLDLVLFESFLSVEAIAIAAFLGVLVLNQRLSYFHSVRYLFLFAYLSFAVIVGAEMALSFVTDSVRAATLLKIEITAILAATLLLGTSSSVLYLQAKSKVDPYRELLRRPPLSLVLALAFTLGALLLVWTVFSFHFEVSAKPLSGRLVIFPVPTGPEFTVLTLVLLTFIWNQTKLLSSVITKAHPESLARVIRRTGLLWIAVGIIVFTFNGLFRYLGFNLVEFGHLFSGLFLGYLAYEYTRPTALLAFFQSSSTLAMQMKRRNFSRIMSFESDQPSHKKILFEVDSLSNHSEIVSYFLGSGSGPAVLITYEGSKLLDSLNEPVKTIELSLSAEKMVVSSQEKMTAGLTSKNVYEVLKWAIECNPNGKIVFDGLSHFILLLGVDEVYSMVTYASELCARHNTELLLIVTKKAHSPDVLGLLEGWADYVIEFDRANANQMKPQGKASILIS